jgi:hypothetical protein
MERPSPDDPHPLRGFPQVGFLKPLVHIGRSCSRFAPGDVGSEPRRELRLIDA